MQETKHKDIWQSEEVAWEMKGKMNPTEVLSVGRGDWCSGHLSFNPFPEASVWLFALEWSIENEIHKVTSYRSDCVG